MSDLDLTKYENVSVIAPKAERRQFLPYSIQRGGFTHPRHLFVDLAVFLTKYYSGGKAENAFELVHPTSLQLADPLDRKNEVILLRATSNIDECVNDPARRQDWYIRLDTRTLLGYGVGHMHVVTDVQIDWDSPSRELAVFVKPDSTYHPETIIRRGSLGFVGARDFSGMDEYGASGFINRRIYHNRSGIRQDLGLNGGLLWWKKNINGEYLGSYESNLIARLGFIQTDASNKKSLKEVYRDQLLKPLVPRLESVFDEQGNETKYSYFRVRLDYKWKMLSTYDPSRAVSQTKTASAEMIVRVENNDATPSPFVAGQTYYDINSESRSFVLENEDQQWSWTIQEAKDRENLMQKRYAWGVLYSAGDTLTAKRDFEESKGFSNTFEYRGATYKINLVDWETGKLLDGTQEAVQIEVSWEWVFDYDNGAVGESIEPYGEPAFLSEADDVAGSVPMTYNLSVAPHGVGIQVNDQATDQYEALSGNRSSNVVIQRLVDRDTGDPLVDQTKSLCPLVCVYGVHHDTVDEDMYFIVREADIDRPSEELPAGVDTPDSNAILNPESQIAIGEDYSYLISVPAGITTQRYLYLEELDLLGVTSAEILSSGGLSEFSMYSEGSCSVDTLKLVLTDVDGFNVGDRIMYVDAASTEQLLGQVSSIDTAARMLVMVRDPSDPAVSAFMAPAQNTDLYVEGSSTIKSKLRHVRKVVESDCTTLSGVWTPESRTYKGLPAQRSFNKGVRLLMRWYGQLSS